MEELESYFVKFNVYGTMEPKESSANFFVNGKKHRLVIVIMMINVYFWQITVFARNSSQDKSYIFTAQRLQTKNYDFRILAILWLS